MSTKDKQSALMASENDLLQPNTGDIPLETINQQRKYTQYVYMFINILFWFRTSETEANSTK